MISLKGLAIAAATALLFANSSAGANAITLSPAAEGYIGHEGNGTLIGPFAPQPFGILVGTLDGRLQGGDPNLSNEARSIAEFDLGGILPATIQSAMLSFVVRNPSVVVPGTSCFDLVGCPPIAGLELAFFGGTGTVTLSDFSAGSNFADFIPQPSYDVTNTVDVTSLVSGLGEFPSFRFTAIPRLEGEVGINDIALLVSVSVPEPQTIGIVLVSLILLLIFSIWQRWCDHDPVNRSSDAQSAGVQL
jgi:hypothetical protein